LLDNC